MGVVTVTGVDTSRDLGVARVFVRVLGDESERRDSLAGLEAAAPFVRRELGQMLRIRRVPELRFQEDRSMDHAQRIEEILGEVLPDDDPGADTEDEVTDPGAEIVDGFAGGPRSDEEHESGGEDRQNGGDGPALDSGVPGDRRAE